MLMAGQKEKEDLDDISNELELADEDDKIPYAESSLVTTYSLSYIWQIQDR